MDDYLAKPFSLLNLQNVLERWLSGIPANGNGTLCADEQKEGTVILDRAALEELRELDPNGGDALIDMLIATYLDESAKLMARLSNAVAVNDVAGVRSSSHTLKSSTAQLGANGLSALFKEAEHLDGSDLTQSGPKLLEKIEREYGRVIEALKKEMSSNPA